MQAEIQATLTRIKTHPVRLTWQPVDIVPVLLYRAAGSAQASLMLGSQVNGQASRGVAVAGPAAIKHEWT